MRGAARSTVRHRVWLTARCVTTVPMARAQALGEDLTDEEVKAMVSEAISNFVSARPALPHAAPPRARARSCGGSLSRVHAARCAGGQDLLRRLREDHDLKAVERPPVLRGATLYVLR